MTAAKPHVVIIDYGSGNLRSVAKALSHVAPEHARVEATAEARTLADATHIVLPGVGAFADCARGLRALPGMVEALEEQVLARRKPMLGICVGMQLLFEEGHEHGVHAGLGWLSGKVVALTPDDETLKIPHMGWNELQCAAPQHALLAGLENSDHAYFVHSYHAQARPENIIATADYGGPVVAAVATKNIMGVQFHPEKSQAVGLQLLRNFITM